MTEEYESFRIEPRGTGETPVAILIKRHPYSEHAFNEASLVLRISNLEKHRRDASVSRSALYSLRNALASLLSVSPDNHEEWRRLNEQ